MRRAVITLVVLAVLISTQFATANGESIIYRQLFGGADSDFARGIFVDSNYIYVVGRTWSFGLNPPNLFLSIFRLDNSHKCSVAVDFAGSDHGWRVIAYGGNVYVVGETSYGTDPTNVLLVKFDTNCNVIGSAVYDIDGADLPLGLSISPDGLTLFVSGVSATGAHLLAIRTSDFSVAWSRRFNFTNPSVIDSDVAYSVAFSDNKLFVTGRTAGGNLFVSKFDAATGDHELSKVFASPLYEDGRDVVVAGGKVYVAGNYGDPTKQLDFLFMRFDTNLNLELAKTFGTPAFEEVVSLSMVGGLVYGVGTTNVTGSWGAVLFAINRSTSDLSHAFVLARSTSSLISQDSTSTGKCLIYTGCSSGWPAYYTMLDMVATGVVSFTVSMTAPSIAIPSVTTFFPTANATGFTPTFNSPVAGDAFYSWFCPDALVASTTTTITSTIATTGTVLTTLTLSTTVTSVVGSTLTVYDIRTTTITQTSFVTATTTQLTTYSTTISATTTLTRSTTYSTTATQSTTTTITQSITTTLITTTTSTQYFAEPITTYVVPLLLVINTALLGASLVMGRRRKSSLG
jgi:hypothetical protein